MKPSTVLVAGGAGFVGSHLCDRLIADGYGVVCLDNLYTGSMGNIRHLTADGRFSFVEHDVNEPFRMQDVSLVFNLACPASPVHYQKDAVFTTRTAVIGTLNLLELARKNGCPLIQASTSEVYGDPTVHPQQESYWAYVDDLIEGFMRVMNTGDDFTGPVNLGNPEEYTVKELAELIIRLTVSSSNLIYQSLPRDCTRKAIQELVLHDLLLLINDLYVFL